MYIYLSFYRSVHDAAAAAAAACRLSGSLFYSIRFYFHFCLHYVDPVFMKHLKMILLPTFSFILQMSISDRFIFDRFLIIGPPLSSISNEYTRYRDVYLYTIIFTVQYQLNYEKQTLDGVLWIQGADESTVLVWALVQPLILYFTYHFESIKAWITPKHSKLDKFQSSRTR